MYSIFSTKSRKLRRLEEGEPPPKKLISEADTVIKKLSKEQLKTTVSLEEQLRQQKEFTAPDKFTNVAKNVSGTRNLQDFQSKLSEANEMDRLRSKGLSNKDIEIYSDYLSLGPDFWTKHKEVNRDVLEQQVCNILSIVNKNSDECTNCSNHKAASSQLSSAIDNLPELEQEFMLDIEEYSKCDIKKIRKKARALGNKIKELDKASVKCEMSVPKLENIQRKTLWDVKEKPNKLDKKVEIIDKDKVYSCKPQNWYTIKDGQIVKLNSNSKTIVKTTFQESIEEKTKLSVEEIRQLPKFSNYDAGTVSKILFLKNLGKTVTQDFLGNCLARYNLNGYSIKIMSGKMKGQGFVEFQEENQAVLGLEALNGVTVDGRPIIVQFGRKKS